jgi:hypothetical protein
MILSTILISLFSIGQTHLLSAPNGGGLFAMPSLYQGQTRGGAAKIGAEKIPQEFLTGGNVEMRKKFEKLCRDAQVNPRISSY